MTAAALAEQNNSDVLYYLGTGVAGIAFKYRIAMELVCQAGSSAR